MHGHLHDQNKVVRGTITLTSKLHDFFFPFPSPPPPILAIEQFYLNGPPHLVHTTFSNDKAQHEHTNKIIK